MNVKQSIIVLGRRILKVFLQLLIVQKRLGQIELQMRRLREKESLRCRDNLVEEDFVGARDGREKALALIRADVARREETRAKAFVLRGVGAEQAIERGQRRWPMLVDFVETWQVFLFELLEEEIR